MTARYFIGHACQEGGPGLLAMGETCPNCQAVAPTRAEAVRRPSWGKVGTCGDAGFLIEPSRQEAA